jgi:hypothetical protein
VDAVREVLSAASWVLVVPGCRSWMPRESFAVSGLVMDGRERICSSVARLGHDRGNRFALGLGAARSGEGAGGNANVDVAVRTAADDTCACTGVAVVRFVLSLPDGAQVIG